MARRFTVEDWQRRLDALSQNLDVIDKRKSGKKEIFTLCCRECGKPFDADRKALATACLLRENGKCKTKWCPICNRKRSAEGINDVATLRKDLVKYFANTEDAKRYSIGSHAEVLLKCPDCGKEKIIAVSTLCANGFHCDYCSDNLSLGNKMIRNLCLQLPLDEYDFEFSDLWTRNKRYDCYFVYRLNKYLIEMDGEQHTRDTNWASRDDQEKNDSLKNELARHNGYEIIRIKAYETDFDYIKDNILGSKLSEIFDLSNIDWDKIYEQTITSVNVEMANYYMEHKDMTMKDIAKHFHVSCPTLRKALKKLTKVGLCDYTKEMAFKNAMKYNAEKKAKNNPPFMVYSPEGILLGVFNNANKCFYTLQKEFDLVGLTVGQLHVQLYTGDDFKGYRFVYEQGLYEYHKNKHPVLFRTCELFNEGHSVKEISLMTNLSMTVVYKNLKAGANMGICNYQKRFERKVG